MGAYEKALAGLNEAQKLAVTTTEGPVLVIAGPGTGKTQLLTTRIAYILANTDTLPQNILCLTFTDSAAITMRERLSGMIGQAAYDVTISTYHAFGSDLIRRFPEYFADNPDLQPIDDLGIDGIFREIIGSLPFSNPLKYADAYVRDIKSLVSDAKRALLTPEDVRTVARQNLEYIAVASPIVADVLGDLVRVSKKNAQAFSQLAERLHALPSPDQGPTPVMPLGSMVTDSLDEALEQAEQTGKQTSLTQWKNTWLARDSNNRFVIDGLHANQKLLAVADIYDQYLQMLHSRDLFDYDDMILRAVRALETKDELRYTLQERYLYILLDEFQDTNGAQLKMVSLLTDNPVHEGRPNILAVGDDDQAIYAFQGANYSHMLQFNQMFRSVLTVPLTKNYRSHADILHTAQGIAEQIRERLHHHFSNIKKVLSAENTSLPPAIVERREAQSDVMQFGWTAHRIRQLIDGGLPPHEIAVLAPQHKYLEPLVPFLQQQDIPVRYDKRENILDDPSVNQLLRMAELCLALSGGEQVQANALWAEVLSFPFWHIPTSFIWQLSWQAHDEDRSWSEVLLADPQCKTIALFFIRLSQLASTETLETMLDYLIGSQPLELNEPGLTTYTSPYYVHYFGTITAQVTSRDEKASTIPTPVSLFDPPAQAAAANANESTGDAPLFWDLLTNLIVLRSRLRDYKHNTDERLHLADFIDFVEAYRAADLKVLNTSPHVSDSDAVQLMTAYKAKGMEFTAVFILAVQDESWGTKARGSGSRIGLPANVQFIRYAGATNDERLRLFYVALTRAKSQLYMLSYASTYAGKATTRLKFLDEHTDETASLRSPLLPEDKQAVLLAEQQALAPTTELAAYWQQRHEYALTRADLRSLLQERLAQFQLSPTHLNDFVDVMYCGPAPFFVRTILRFPEAPRPGVQFGNAMHETLEWLHKVTRQDGLLPSEKATLKTFAQRLQAKRLSARDTELLLERGTSALQAFLQQRGHTVQPDAVVEYSFRSEGVFAGKAHLTGKIDKLIIDQQAKTITIVDFKTGKSYSRWTAEAKLHKYRQQLYFYRALVEGSHTYAGYHVTDAYLEFVEPDDAGVIRELHLVFDDAEYRRVRQLAEKVWQYIKTITLPDVSDYSADFTGIKAFESDLLS